MLAFAHSAHNVLLELTSFLKAKYKKIFCFGFIPKAPTPHLTHPANGFFSTTYLPDLFLENVDSFHLIDV
jgi:hypothetical protein